MVNDGNIVDVFYYLVDHAYNMANVELGEEDKRLLLSYYELLLVFIGKCWKSFWKWYLTILSVQDISKANDSHSHE